MKMVFSIAVAIGLLLVFRGVISHNDRFEVDKEYGILSSLLKLLFP